MKEIALYIILTTLSLFEHYLWNMLINLLLSQNVHNYVLTMF